MPFRLYNSLMGLAKESLHSEAGTPEEEGESTPAVVKAPELVDLGPNTEPEVLNLVDKLKELLSDLPKANIATLRYLIRHLRKSVYFIKEKLNVQKSNPRESKTFCLSPIRIAELEEDNKMGPSNLGIVFGPSLMRPRPTGATISLSSLVDYPHQARIVEAFIVFYPSIFHCQSSQRNKSSRPSSTPSQQVATPVWVQIHSVLILKSNGKTLVNLNCGVIMCAFYFFGT